MTDNPKWMTRVARDIKIRMIQGGLIEDETIAIILKHCPEDKVGKLVGACKAALPILEDARDRQKPPSRYQIRLVKEALDDYEANK